MKISTKNMFRNLLFLFFYFVYIFRVFTQQVSAPNSTLPGGKSKKCLFPPLNHPLYYRAPAGVSPIFRATLPTSTELISWTKKSDHQFFLFFEHVGGNIHQKKLVGGCYDCSTRLKIIGIFFVTDNSEIRYTPTWRA